MDKNQQKETQLESLHIISDFLQGLVQEGKIVFHTRYLYEARQLELVLDSMDVSYRRIIDADITIYELTNE